MALPTLVWGESDDKESDDRRELEASPTAGEIGLAPKLRLMFSQMCFKKIAGPTHGSHQPFVCMASD